MKILCSTGAFITRANNRNHLLIEKVIEEVQADGLEFMMYASWYDSYQKILNDLKAMHANIPMFHIEKSIGEYFATNESSDLEKAIELFKINCYMAREVGATGLVFHLWNGLISDHNIQANIKAYGKFLEIAKQYELMLTVENVVCAKQDPMTHWKSLTQIYPDIKFTFDTKMAAFHNQVDCICEKEWNWLWSQKHIAHLHVNDYSGGYKNWDSLKVLHIGKGDIDFASFFSFLKQQNPIPYLTIEATSVAPDGSLRTDLMNQSILKLRNFINQQ